MRRAVLALLISLGLGPLGLYLVAGPAAFQLETYRLPTISLPLALLIAAAAAAYWLVPALRLQALSVVQGHGLPFGTGLLIHLVGLYGAAVTPGGSGGAPAIAAALRRAGLSLGAGVAMAVQVTVLDLVFFAWALPVSLAYLLLGGGATALSADLVALALVSMAAAIAASIVLGRCPRLAVRLLLWLASRPTLTRFRSRLTAGARAYYRSSRLFGAMPFSAWVSLQALSALGWLGMFVLCWSLVRAFQPLALLPTVASLTIVTLVAFIVPTPGGSGFIEVAVGYGLGAQSALADSVTPPLLLWRLATFYLIFLLGPLASGLLVAGRCGRVSAGKRPTPEEDRPRHAS
jgi:glycosyltransferase 2 family protein